MEKILITAVDIDNDLGEKTQKKDLIISYKKALSAATEFALRDPLDSDLNSFFAALKEYNSLKNKYQTEICFLTGENNFMEARKKIKKQLQEVFSKFKADGIILITDGKSDEQIESTLEEFAPIIEKKRIIVKQSSALEGAYITFKEALKKKEFKINLLGIPGLFIFLISFFGKIALKYIFSFIGLYLIVIGFGINNLIIKIYREIKKEMSTPMVILYSFGLIFTAISPLFGLTLISIFYVLNSFPLYEAHNIGRRMIISYFLVISFYFYNKINSLLIGESCLEETLLDAIFATLGFASLYMLNKEIKILNFPHLVIGKTLRDISGKKLGTIKDLKYIENKFIIKTDGKEYEVDDASTDGKNIIINYIPHRIPHKDG